MTTVELEPIRSRLAGLGREHTPADVAAALRAEGTVVTDAILLRTLEVLRRDSVGAGILEPLLRLPGVTDVVVNGPAEVYVDVGGGLQRTELAFTDEAEVRRLAQRLAASVGRRLDDASPYVDARLPDGTRVHAVLGTLAAPGTCLSLRIPADRSFSLADCVASGSVSEAAADLLIRIVESRSAFLISGGTGSGKTTLLAALLGLVPATERIVIAEDSRELAPRHPHVVRLEGRPANAEGVGTVTLTDLVRQALRMRPDRLVVGEVRGAEVCDLLAALNTGHEGGCGTLHANAATQVPARLEALAALGGMDRSTLHAQLAAAVELVIHLVRDRTGPRRVAEIATLAQDPRTGLVVAEPALIFDRGGPPRRGPAAARLELLLERS
ncbi:TadA family conjugal transfer-associated ATPase [Microlunatus speluncae]|uniref:TadA family conjugal transfer-associated ATPase n=1 Tax=Microlunatus speluncae TaxID=2594267 RepID=UPI0012664F31|nr:TadA family conjugal transfer-associated ATPase [Microlunatus speluncae]